MLTYNFFHLKPMKGSLYYAEMVGHIYITDVLQHQIKSIPKGLMLLSEILDKVRSQARAMD